MIPATLFCPPPTPVRRFGPAALLHGGKDGNLRRSLVAALACLNLAGPSFAEPSQTIAPATMRKMPSANSRVVQHIPADAEIDVSRCGGGWCYGSWRNLFGYIPADAVVAGPPGVEAPVAMAPPVAVAAPPVVVGPAWGWGGPYVGFGWGYRWRRW